MKEVLRIPRGLDGWIWRYRFANDAFRVHHHDELELNLVTEGSASYLVDDRRYVLRRGTMIWLFPEQKHLLLDQSRDYSMQIAVFRPALLRRMCTSAAARMLLQRRPEGDFTRQLTERAARRAESLLAEIVAAKDDAPRFNAGIAYALLELWAVHQASERTMAHDLHPAVERAARLVRAQDEDAETLPKLAERCGLSPSRLSRLFKRQTGVSMVRYRQRLQLEQFLRLYDDGSNRNMMQCALQAGFGSYPQFHRVFRQLMGVSPAKYRREGFDR